MSTSTTKPLTPRGAMRTLGYRWNFLKGQQRHRWQSDEAFIWQLDATEGVAGQWVGRKRVQGNMHQRDVRLDVRNWNTWTYGPADSPVAIATQLALEG